MERTISIDTNVGGEGLFAPKGEVDDYPGWLEFQYKSSQETEGSKPLYYGFSQRVNQVVYASQNGATVSAHGEHAGQVAFFLEKMGAKDVSLS